jgi:HK97 family phage portal protein
MAFELIRKALGSTNPLYQNNLPAVYNNTLTKPVGNEIKLYPQDTGAGFISKGYNLNDAIFSIVGKNAEKFGQPRLYHMVIQKDETKTLREYNQLKNEPVTPHSVKEMRRMFKSMVEDKVPDSKLANLLNTPNRFQSQSEWLEQLFGFRELTGEANLYLNRGVTDGPPLELLIIPKPHLNLIVDPNNPWEIVAFEIVIGVNRKRVDKEDLLMWKYTSYLPLDNNEHLRGQAPLESARVLMQGMNEADIRVATSNKNAGASGLLYSNLINPKTLDSNDAFRYRQQVNNVVNNTEMAGKIAMLAGEWGYHSFGYSLDDLKVLEQYGLGFKRLCRVFRTPPGIHAEGTDTYENVKQYKRDWIYDLISPRLNQLTGILNGTLLSEFDLDPETNLIDYDINSLPEVAEDLKEQVAAIRDVWEMTPNQKLKYWGFEPDPDPRMDIRLVPTGLQTFDELHTPVGGDLSNEMQDLTP